MALVPGGTRSFALVGSVLLAMACAPRTSSEPAAGLGRRVHSGPVRALSPSPGGAALAFLDGCMDVKAPFLPPQIARCDLRVLDLAKGKASKIAAGVTTLPRGVTWSPDGTRLLALADYDHSSAAGTLVGWRAGSARVLGEGVTFHGFGAHGELGFIRGGQLWVILPGETDPRAVAGADQISSFDISPIELPACEKAGALVRLLARKSHAAGGQLLASGCDLKQARRLEQGQVGEYGFASGSTNFAYTTQGNEGASLRLVEAGIARTVTVDLGKGARSFAFDPDGRTIAFVADVVPGKQGDLHLAGPARKDVVIAREVGEFRWARSAPRLAWLEQYDPRVRAGAIGTGGPDLPARVHAKNVSDFELSPDGRHLAFLQHTTRGGYSVDLGRARLDGSPSDKAATVARGVFGFAFSPDGSWLYYRTRCVRNGEACDLERVPSGGLAEGAKPELVASGVKSFDFDPRDPGRLLLGWQRMDMVALDIGIWQAGSLTSIDTAVLPGSASFLGPDSRRVAYVVAQPKRAGVYVANLPK